MVITSKVIVTPVYPVVSTAKLIDGSAEPVDSTPIFPLKLWTAPAVLDALPFAFRARSLAGSVVLNAPLAPAESPVPICEPCQPAGYVVDEWARDEKSSAYGSVRGVGSRLAGAAALMLLIGADRLVLVTCPVKISLIETPGVANVNAAGISSMTMKIRLKVERDGVEMALVKRQWDDDFMILLMG